jgi:hypothetical protein
LPWLNLLRRGCNGGDTVCTCNLRLRHRWLA